VSLFDSTHKTESSLHTIRSAGHGAKIEWLERRKRIIWSLYTTKWESSQPHSRKAVHTFADDWLSRAGNYSHRMMGGRLHHIHIKMSGPKNDDGNHQKRKASHIKNFTFTAQGPCVWVEKTRRRTVTRMKKHYSTYVLLFIVQHLLLFRTTYKTCRVCTLYEKIAQKYHTFAFFVFVLCRLIRNDLRPKKYNTFDLFLKKITTTTTNIFLLLGGLCLGRRHSFSTLFGKFVRSP
jgi:hypothetical protein